MCFERFRLCPCVFNCFKITCIYETLSPMFYINVFCFQIVLRTSIFVLTPYILRSEAQSRGPAKKQIIVKLLELVNVPYFGRSYLMSCFYFDLVYGPTMGFVLIFKQLLFLTVSRDFAKFVLDNFWVLLNLSPYCLVDKIR